MIVGLTKKKRQRYNVCKCIRLLIPRKTIKEYSTENGRKENYHMTNKKRGQKRMPVKV